MKIRCSEIATKAILGQKQSRNSYMAHRILLPLFGCPYIHAFVKPALIEHILRVWPHKIVREGTMIGRIAGGTTDGEIEY